MLNIAGAVGKAVSTKPKDGQLGSFKSSLANTWNTARKKVGYFITGESNAEFPNQSSVFEVPDNAFFETIGEYPDSVNTTAIANSLYVNRASGAAGHLVFSKTATASTRTTPQSPASAWLLSRRPTLATSPSSSQTS